jgi:hypothetical protein
VANGALSHNGVEQKVGSSRKLYVEIRNDSKNSALLYTVIVFPVGGLIARFYCTAVGGVLASEKVVVDVSNAPLLDDLMINITGSAGSQGSYTIYSDLPAIRSYQTKEVIRRNLYVFVFDNAPLRATARLHVEEAVRIWREVGVDFKPVYKDLNDAETEVILGKHKRLTVFFGPDDKNAGEWQDRERVQKLKSNIRSFGVAFARTTFEGFGGTKADLDRSQAYIDEDVMNAPIGRTVAHELGHLLLGEGHTGAKGSLFTSGLMRLGTESDAKDISDADAKLARARAVSIPKD